MKYLTKQFVTKTISFGAGRWLGTEEDPHDLLREEGYSDGHRPGGEGRLARWGHGRRRPCLRHHARFLRLAGVLVAPAPSWLWWWLTGLRGLSGDSGSAQAACGAVGPGSGPRGPLSLSLVVS